MNTVNFGVTVTSQSLTHFLVIWLFTEYEVISTTKGPDGEQVSILTTNQTHTAVENLKPESRYSLNAERQPLYLRHSAEFDRCILVDVGVKYQGC